MTTTANTYNNIPKSKLWGLDMKGARPEGKCPKCGCAFTEQNGYECPEHETTPKRYSWQRYAQGETIRRGRDLHGNTIRTLAQISELNGELDRELAANEFNIARWRGRQGIDFNCESYVWKWQKEKEDLSPSNRYGTYVKYYILPYFKGKNVKKVVSLKPFVRAIPGLAPKGKPSPKYIKNILDATLNFFKFIKDHFWEEYQIVLQVPTAPGIDVPEYEPQTVSRDVQDMFLKVVDSEHLAIFTFLVYQGARPSEVRALKGDCIDGDTVTYRRTFSDRSIVEHTKNKKIRYNYIFPEVLAVLPATFPDQFVFRINNRPYSNNQLNDLYRKYLAAFNKKYKTVLDLPLYEFTKHSFGTQFINENPDLERVLQGHFGHSSIEMTRRYAKFKTVDAFRKLAEVADIEKRKTDMGDPK